MAVARGFENKTELTPDEKVMSAYLYLCRGVSQDVIAAAYRVNSGRVAEAVDAVRIAVEWPHKEEH